MPPWQSWRHPWINLLSPKTASSTSRWEPSIITSMSLIPTTFWVPSGLPYLPMKRSTATTACPRCSPWCLGRKAFPPISKKERAAIPSSSMPPSTSRTGITSFRKFGTCKRIRVWEEFSARRSRRVGFLGVAVLSGNGHTGSRHW